MPDAPTRDELRAYLAGNLPQDRFAAVDTWLTGLPEAEAEQVLAELDVPNLPNLSQLLSIERPETGFQPTRAASRAVEGLPLGSGGMAEVRIAHDRVLERSIALKVLKARKPDEDLEAYFLREAAFRREAALTASLDHPAIPPVYDIGKVDGRSAFTMKRLEGRTLATVVAEGKTPLIDLIQAITRVAEAVAFAHARGIVHRDLSPDNVLLGDFGAVYVLDWGVAAAHGSETTVRVGTPAWMAPEQQYASRVDRGMDVWALGALIHLILYGCAPAAALATRARRSIPRGLLALSRRCLEDDPQRRYADAGLVAEELHRWLDQGLTLAQGAGPLEIAWLRLRRSPRLSNAVLVSAVAALLLVGIGWWSHAQSRSRTEQRIQDISHSVQLDHPDAIAVALDEIRVMRAAWPDLTSAAALESRLLTARDVAEANALSAQIKQQLGDLLLRTRQLGPWADQVEPWRKALRQTGLTLDPAQLAHDIACMQVSPLAALQAESLAFLWRAERELGATTQAEAVAHLLAQAGPSPGWRALGRLLPSVPFRAHDPAFCPGNDADAVLADTASAAAALALFAPEPSLTAYARQRLVSAPGDFWSLIAAGRAALNDHDIHEAQHLAFIASGAEPGSLLPRLLLAYVALENEVWDVLLTQVERGLQTDSTNVELITLRAVALAHLHREAEAQALVDSLPAGHLRFHLTHRVGHPMELAVDALVAAGMHIAEAPPNIGPLAPAHHH